MTLPDLWFCPFLVKLEWTIAAKQATVVHIHCESVHDIQGLYDKMGINIVQSYTINIP